MLRMKLSSKLFGTLLLTMLVAFIGCSSGDDGGPSGSGSDPFAVTTVTPNNGGADVSVSSAVTVNFSQNIDPTTVSSASVYIEGVNGSAVASGKSVVFSPATRLAEATTFTIRVTTDVKDANGNALAAAYSSTFTTGVTPSASAGSDFDVNRSESVNLSGSSNLTGASYSWTQISGPTVGDLSGQSVSFNAPDSVSTIAFEMVASLGSNMSEPDTIVIFVLEDKAASYWVSISGDDNNSGTRTAPKATIGAAVAASKTDANGADIYIAAGTFSESVALGDNISLYGGYNQNNWMRDHAVNVSTIDGGTIAVKGLSTHNVTIDGLTIRSANATTASGSSIALSFDSSTSLVITNNLISSGNGFAGNNGIQPTTPGKANKGSGGSGAGGCSPANVGGNGGSGSSRGGGKGGSGGAAGGFDGNGGTGPCGNGGNGGFASSGSVGSNGCTGGSGDSANVAGSSFGTVANGIYYPANGSTGKVGGHGGGGGGGGGGAGSLFGCGAGGGGGGAGGYRGTGGPSGKGGGGSFGIILTNGCTATIVDNSITTSNGALGGYGGVGGNGASGGNYGSGGGSATGGWAGGRGGNGGTGGKGGYGSCAGGGPTIAIVEQGSTTFQDRITFTLGQFGLGGERSNGRGLEGADGERAEVKKIQ